MIPNFFTFIRAQDKKLIAKIYLTALIFMFLLWKNNGYSFSENYLVLISVAFSLAFYPLLQDVKPYWIYCVSIKKVDVRNVTSPGLSSLQKWLSRPFILSLLSACLCIVIFKLSMIFLGPMYASLCAFILCPLVLYLSLRFCRLMGLKQILVESYDILNAKTLYRLVAQSVIVTLTINLLMISPLKNRDEFLLSRGFNSIDLMVAMFILCAIVLLINLFFSRSPKKYVFLGKLFMKEMDDSILKRIPLTGWRDTPFAVRIFLVLIVQFFWIVILSLLLALAPFNLCFELYFIACYLPSIVYYFFHLYWFWLNEFVMACDMSMRYQEFLLRENWEK